ncbi:hypothetical protein GCM10020256_39660 [Streptomyces thermocoprophilus]
MDHRQRPRQVPGTRRKVGRSLGRRMPPGLSSQACRFKLGGVAERQVEPAVQDEIDMDARLGLLPGGLGADPYAE